MPRPVHIIGLGADGLAGLTPRLREAIASAEFLAGGKRHLALLGPTGAETLAITTNFIELAERLRCRGQDERCVVVGSGDPLFFGIGRFLGDKLGRDQIRIDPSLSSMQLAFARAGLPWDDAVMASIHGRDLAATLLPLLGKPTIGLLTHDGESPAAIAAFFLDRGLVNYEAYVGENLGSEHECWTTAPMDELRDRQFAALNVVILHRKLGRPDVAPWDPPSGTGVGPGIPDLLFEQPKDGPILLTHADVRAIAVSRFRILPAGPILDVGAGLGGVSIELARAFPDRAILAVERSPTNVTYLHANRTKFAAWNLRIVLGEAPACLPADEQVAGLFLGGTGGHLDGILTDAIDRLKIGGTLVGNFVGLENFAKTMQRLREANWKPEATQVQVSHARPLADLTTFVPLRPVWIVKAVKPNGQDCVSL
ncbi:MAG: precorrin-6y C5,15-methyltransferase (decarboxylating), CbiE subunit,precorrin-6Y [Planctomycetota bacterium]|nr:precorrin-6y C5,15-methyltransferase (decarboxylating), CbiE subunit,precorrin-6Y [Planctomycetota bacterium]